MVARTMKKGPFMENYIAEGHSYYRGTRERGKRRRLYLNLASLSDCFPSVSSTGWTQTEIRLWERPGDVVCSSQPPRTQDRAEKDAVEGAKRRASTRWPSLPFRHDWFSSCQLSKCQASTSRDAMILWESPGLWVEDLRVLQTLFIIGEFFENQIQVIYRLLPSRNITPALFLSSVSYLHPQSFPFLTWMVGLFWIKFYRIRIYVYLVHGHVPKSAIT